MHSGLFLLNRSVVPGVKAKESNQLILCMLWGGWGETDVLWLGINTFFDKLEPQTNMEPSVHLNIIIIK